MKDFLKIRMTPKNIQLIKGCKGKLKEHCYYNNYNINDDVLYSTLILDIFKESLLPDDIKINYTDKKMQSEYIDTHYLLWFMLYYLIPLNEAKTYKEAFRIISSMWSMKKVSQHSLMLLIDVK